jgi:hypothetical protein
LYATISSDGHGADPRSVLTKELTMRPAKRRAIRDQLTPPNGEQLPDGVGGTITGGPMERFDLMEILRRTSLSVSRGGAVSGAAQVVISGLAEQTGRGDGADRGIALSDGSRITFASVTDAGVMNEEDANALTREDVRVLADA